MKERVVWFAKDGDGKVWCYDREPHKSDGDVDVWDAFNAAAVGYVSDEVTEALGLNGLSWDDNKATRVVLYTDVETHRVGEVSEEYPSPSFTSEDVKFFLANCLSNIDCSHPIEVLAYSDSYFERIAQDFNRYMYEKAKTEQ